MSPQVMKRRIAGLGLLLAFLAAPALGAVELASCSPCCPRPAAEDPCDPGEAPCHSFSEVACCEIAPASAPPPASRSLDAPNAQPTVVAAGPRAAVVQRVQPPPIPGDLALRTSPLRLSVVLLI